MNDEIFSTVKGQSKLYEKIKNMNIWEQCTEPVYESQEIENLKSQHKDLKSIVVVLSKIKKDSQNQFYIVTTTIHEAISCRDINFQFRVPIYFINLNSRQKTEINYLPILLSQLNRSNGSDQWRETDYEPFGGCNLAEFSLKSSLSEMGIEESTYHSTTESFSFEAILDERDEAIILPYDNNAIKEYIFRKMLKEHAPYLSETLTSQLLSEELAFSYIYYPHNLRGQNRVMYILYKIKYRPQTAKASIYAELYYSIDLELKRHFSNKELQRLSTEGIYKIIENLRSRMVSELKDYIDKKFKENQTIYELDIGRFLKTIDTQIETGLKQQLKISGHPDIANVPLTRLLDQFSEIYSVYGYKSGQWTLNPITELIIEKLIEHIFDDGKYQNFEYKVYITGFTDSDLVSRDGILNQYYQKENICNLGCITNESFTRLDEPCDNDHPIIGARITDNCQLSTLRAYTVAKYIENLIPNTSTIFYQGRGALNNKNKYYDRKVVIKTVLERP